MNIEITNKPEKTPVGWIFYDGECAFCIAWVNRLRRLFVQRGFEFVPLQTPWVRESLKLDDAVLMREMLVRFPNGRVYGGADGLAELARHSTWTWLFWAFSRVPGALAIMRCIYQFIAAKRQCLSGACDVPQHKHNTEKNMARTE